MAGGERHGSAEVDQRTRLALRTPVVNDKPLRWMYAVIMDTSSPIGTGVQLRYVYVFSACRGGRARVNLTGLERHSSDGLEEMVEKKQKCW